jgi:hypothetical protein
MGISRSENARDGRRRGHNYSPANQRGLRSRQALKSVTSAATGGAETESMHSRNVLPRRLAWYKIYWRGAFGGSELALLTPAVRTVRS